MKIHLLRPVLIDADVGVKFGDIDMADERRAQDLVRAGKAIDGFRPKGGFTAAQLRIAEQARIAARDAGGKPMNVARQEQPAKAMKEPTKAKPVPKAKKATVKKILPGKGGGVKPKPKAKPAGK